MARINYLHRQHRHHRLVLTDGSVLDSMGYRVPLHRVCTDGPDDIINGRVNIM